LVKGNQGTEEIAKRQERLLKKENWGQQKSIGLQADRGLDSGFFPISGDLCLKTLT